MTESEEKTFKVVCPHCGKPFHSRHRLSRAESGRMAEVVVNCLYCGKAVMITVPEKYVPEEHLVRGLKGLPSW